LPRDKRLSAATAVASTRPFALTWWDMPRAFDRGEIAARLDQCDVFFGDFCAQCVEDMLGDLAPVILRQAWPIALR
jgi:hypothetical protein